MDQEDNFYEMPIPPYATGIHVLLVDPDLPSLVNTTSELEEATYQVTGTKLPEVALTKLQDKVTKYDLVLADVNMKGMEYTTFLINVQMLSDIPVILTTSCEKEFKLAKKSLQNGACRILEKPITKDTVRSLWQYVIRNRNRNMDVLGLGPPAEIVPGQLNAEAGAEKSQEQDDDRDTEKGKQIAVENSTRPTRLDDVAKQNNKSNGQTSSFTTNTSNKKKNVNPRKGSGSSMKDASHTATLAKPTNQQLQDCSKELASQVINAGTPDISHGQRQLPIGSCQGNEGANLSEAEARFVENFPATQMTIPGSQCQNVVSNAPVAGQNLGQTNQRNGSESGRGDFSLPVDSTLTGARRGIVAERTLPTQTSNVGSQSLNAPVAAQIPGQTNPYNGSGSGITGSEGFNSPVYSTSTAIGRGVPATGPLATQTHIIGSQSHNAAYNAPVAGQIPNQVNQHNGFGCKIASEGLIFPAYSTSSGTERGVVTTGTLPTQTSIVGSQTPNAPVATQIPSQANPYNGSGSGITGSEGFNLPVNSTSNAIGRGVPATGTLATQTHIIGSQSQNAAYNAPVAGQIPNQVNQHNGFGSKISSEGLCLPVYSTSTVTGRGVVTTGTLATQTTVIGSQSQNAVCSAPVAGQIPSQVNQYSGFGSRIISEGFSLPAYINSPATGRGVPASGTLPNQTSIIGLQFQNSVCHAPDAGQIPNPMNQYNGSGSRITGSEGFILPFYSTPATTGRGVTASGTLPNQTSITGFQSQNAVFQAPIAGQIPNQTNQYNGFGSRSTGAEGFNLPFYPTPTVRGRGVPASGTLPNQTSIIGLQSQNAVYQAPVAGQIPNQINQCNGFGSRITGHEGLNLPVYSTSTATGRPVLASGTLPTQTTIIGLQSQNAVCHAPVGGQIPNQMNQYNGFGSGITGAQGINLPVYSTLVGAGRGVLPEQMPSFNSQSSLQGTNSWSFGNHVNRLVPVDGGNSASGITSGKNISNQFQDSVNNNIDHFGSTPPMSLKERVDRIRQAYMATIESGKTGTAAEQHTSDGLDGQRTNESNQQDKQIGSNVSVGIANRSVSNGKRNRSQFEGLSNEKDNSSCQMTGGQVNMLQNDIKSTVNWEFTPLSNIYLPNPTPNAPSLNVCQPTPALNAPSPNVYQPNSAPNAPSIIVCQQNPDPNAPSPNVYQPNPALNAPSPNVYQPNPAPNAPSLNVCPQNLPSNASQIPFLDNSNPSFVEKGAELPPQPTELYGAPNLLTSSPVNNSLLFSNETPIQQVSSNQELSGIGMSSNACLPNHDVEETNYFDGTILEAFDTFNHDTFLEEATSILSGFNDNDIYLDDILAELGNDYMIDDDLKSLASINP